MDLQGQQGCARIVVISRKLLNDTVRTAIQTDCHDVVTGPSSPFCHGANALRVLASRGAAIRWWLAEEVASLPVGPRQAEGRFTDTPVAGLILSSGEGLMVRPADAPFAASANLVAIGLHSNQMAIVGMTGRQYDPLTASIMIPGLRDGARWLCGEPVSVVRADSGHLLLLSAKIGQQAMIRCLADPDRAPLLLRRHKVGYSRLFDAWRSSRSTACRSVGDLRAAGSLLRRFFGLLLLLHTSYTEAMDDSLRRLKLSESARREVALAAVPDVLRWQVGEVGLFSASKDLLEPGGEVPTPGFTIADDLAATTGRVRMAVAVDSSASLEQLILVSVLKEWKFFLAKALHRHFSTAYRSAAAVGQLSQIPDECQVRALTFSQLLRQLEASHGVVRSATGRCR
jgi:hypothetical protein